MFNTDPDPRLFHVSTAELRSWANERVEGEKLVLHAIDAELAPMAANDEAKKHVEILRQERTNEIQKFEMVALLAEVPKDERLTFDQLMRLRDQIGIIDVARSVAHFKRQIQAANEGRLETPAQYQERRARHGRTGLGVVGLAVERAGDAMMKASAESTPPSDDGQTEEPPPPPPPPEHKEPGPEGVPDLRS